jgi:hypothetical protein
MSTTFGITSFWIAIVLLILGITFIIIHFNKKPDPDKQKKPTKAFIWLGSVSLFVSAVLFVVAFDDYGMGLKSRQSGPARMFNSLNFPENKSN